MDLCITRSNAVIIYQYLDKEENWDNMSPEEKHAFTELYDEIENEIGA
jgi:hypothetical protein